MSEKLPSFPFFTYDYLGDHNVEAMTLEEQGAYIRLICHAWNNVPCGHLPNDDKKLAALSRLGEKWEASKETIKAAFQVIDKWIVQKRLVREFQKYEKFIQEQSEKGKLSWQNRKAKQRLLNHGSTEPMASHSPVQTGPLTAPPTGPQPITTTTTITTKVDSNLELIGGVGEETTKTAAVPPSPAQKKKSDKGNKLPDGFEITTEMMAWAFELGIKDVKGVTEAFRDHFKANGECKKDWTAAWRNWMRNELKFYGNRGGGGKPPTKGGNLGTYQKDNGKYDDLD